jgi:tmRNA-binding protein
LHNDQWVIDEIKEEIKRFLEVNENKNMAHWNLRDTAKAVLRGQFIALTAHIKKTERCQVNDLMLHLKLLENKEQANPNTNRRREIITLRAEINEIETKTRNIQRIIETKFWFFEKINKIDSTLANLIKIRRDKTQISKIRIAKREITTITMEIQEIIRD